MKQKVGLPAVLLAVVVLAAFMYGVYRLAFAPQSPPPSAKDAPAYARERGMLPDSGNTGAKSAAPPAQNYRPSYGQGAAAQAGHGNASNTPGFLHNNSGNR